MRPPPRSITSPHYHIWTDALHGRHLAHKASNHWDRGTYVRWCQASAWTAFEMACGEALDIPRIGNRFFSKLDSAMEDRGLRTFDRGQGLWQRVKSLHDARHDVVHGRGTLDSLFPAADEADAAISTLRAALIELHQVIGVDYPVWVEDDKNPEIPKGGSARGVVIPAGVDQADPQTVQLKTIDHLGREYDDNYLRADQDPEEEALDLIRRTIVPIRAVRAYQGPEVIVEIETRMRGT